MEKATSEDLDEKGTMDKTRFPPPATWYRTTAAAARDDMWAYLSGQVIVLVKPKSIHTVTTVLQEEEGDKAVGTNVNDREDDWPTFVVFGYQRENYTSLSFCQDARNFLPMRDSPLVTGCQEGLVRLWNVETGKCVAFHDLHKESKKVQITCVDWSVRNSKVVYSIDEEGLLISWYLPKSRLRKFSFGKCSPSSLHASRHEDNLVAVGTKGGVIFIAQTDPTGNGSGGFRILHKVRHDEEIVSTLWCPKSEWGSSTDGGLGPSLASSLQSQRPPSIRLWNKMGEDKGILDVWGHEREERHHKPFRNFSPLAWVTDPNSGLPLLLTSSKKGEIVSYNSQSTLADVVHNVHNHASIFCLVQCGDILWTTSYEPVIVGWNLRTMMVSCVIPTFKGVCAITPSPSVGSLIGFGGSDAYIRVLDFQREYPSKDAVKEPRVSFRMRSKIMALAWHPTKDNWIGFGTDDGMLGYYELREEQNLKSLTRFDHRISGVVYSVCWGPTCGSKDMGVTDEKGDEEEEVKQFSDTGSRDSSFCLYACGGNKVFSIHPSKASSKLIDVSRIIQNTNIELNKMRGGDSDSFVIRSKASDIQWTPDFSLLAVGYSDGRVELYTPPYLTLKCWIKCHARAIQYLNWRSYDFTRIEVDPSHKHRWFATASNDATVKLFDLKDICNEEFLSSQNENQEPKLIISSAATLRSPSGGDRIISTAWSPHDADLIATVSYDSTAIVWNIKDASPLARYMGHLHRLVACTFHPTSPYMLVTASDEFMLDCTVHVWDYRHHPYTDVPASSKRVPTDSTVAIHVKGDDQKAAGSGTNELLSEEDVKPSNPTLLQEEDGSNSNRLHVIDASLISDKSHDDVKKKAKNKSKSLLPSTANVFINTKLSLETEVRHLVKSGKKGKENGHPSSGNGVSAPEKKVADEHASSSMVHLGLLGDFGECVDLMKVECESHAEKGDWEKGCLLASWIGDTSFVERALQAGFVNETVITVARHLSKQLYNKACEAYAKKLIRDEEFGKAATFYLHAGKKEEAIGVLVDNKLYRDAVAMLKVCMLKNNPMQSEVIKKWLIQLIQDGNFEVATKVYCSLGRYEDAADVLEKRDTAYAWKTGILLAGECGSTTRMEVFALKYCMECMGKAEYEEGKGVFNQYSQLKWLLPFLHTHEAIFHLSNKLRDASKDPAAQEKIAVTYDLKDELRNQLDLTEFDGSKLKETVLVSIAQNRTDAEVIMTRTLVLIAMEDPEFKPVAVKEMYMKLCDVWLKEKAPYLHSAYELAFNRLT